jgi:hypothetical protein
MNPIMPRLNEPAAHNAFIEFWHGTGQGKAFVWFPGRGLAIFGDVRTGRKLQTNT